MLFFRYCTDIGFNFFFCRRKPKIIEELTRFFVCRNKRIGVLDSVFLLCSLKVFITLTYKASNLVISRISNALSDESGTRFFRVHLTWVYVSIDTNVSFKVLITLTCKRCNLIVCSFVAEVAKQLSSFVCCNLTRVNVCAYCAVLSRFKVVAALTYIGLHFFVGRCVTLICEELPCFSFCDLSWVYITCNVTTCGRFKVLIALAHTCSNFCIGRCVTLCFKHCTDFGFCSSPWVSKARNIRLGICLCTCTGTLRNILRNFCVGRCVTLRFKRCASLFFSDLTRINVITNRRALCSFKISVALTCKLRQLFFCCVVT